MSDELSGTQEDEARIDAVARALSAVIDLDGVDGVSAMVLLDEGGDDEELIRVSAWKCSGCQNTHVEMETTTTFRWSKEKSDKRMFGEHDHVEDG